MTKKISSVCTQQSAGRPIQRICRRCARVSGIPCYSWLAVREGQKVVVKQIHHEPCDYYSFGNKIEAERNDYERLQRAGIRYWSQTPEFLEHAEEHYG